MRRQVVEQMLPAKGVRDVRSSHQDGQDGAEGSGTVGSTWSFLPQVTSWLS
jgi:hypothetical protein